MAENLLTYTSLKGYVTAALNRDDPRVTQYLDLMITLAQRIITSTYQLQDFLVFSRGTLTPSNPVLPYKDVRWFQNYSMTVSYASEGSPTNDRQKVLTLRTNTYLQEYWQDQNQVGLPIYYADFEKKYLLLAPTPDLAYPYIWGYYAQPPLLSDESQTNIVTERSPQALIGYTMRIVNLFLQNWTDQKSWDEWAKEALQVIKQQDKRLQFDISEIPDHTT